MENFKASKTVTKAAKVVLIFTLLTLAAAIVLIILGIFNRPYGVYQIYSGLGGLVGGLFLYTTYAILIGLAPITKACETHLTNTATNRNSIDEALRCMDEIQKKNSNSI